MFAFKLGDTGARKLARIGAALRAQGDDGKVMRREFGKTMTKVISPVLSAQRTRLRATSAPSQFKALGSRRLRVKTLTGRKTAGVAIRVSGGGGMGAYPDMPKWINRGRWRHPFFGNKEHWYTQTVSSGWFDHPALASRASAERACEDVIKAAMNKIASV